MEANLILLFVMMVFIFLTAVENVQANNNSVIFFHPDGMGVNVWNAVRNYKVGPDGELNWDKLPDIAIYKGHMSDSLVASSHGGATTHAYGVKVKLNSFGMDGVEPLKSASGKPYSLLIEAKKMGKSIGLVNSGTASEPGTAVFASSSENRQNHQIITEQLIENDVDVIFSGGEQWFLPLGVKGYHGEGNRTDDRNIVKEAIAKGYKVIYTKKQLLGVDPEKDQKLLGVFASYHTFNDKSEERLSELNLPLFQEGAPTIAEMTDVAIKILSKNEKGFFLVSEEEATDNFGNKNNAIGVLEAGGRADDAIGVIIEYLSESENTFFITTSDSDAGGMQIRGGDLSKLKSVIDENSIALDVDKNGAPYDGVLGSKTEAFASKPDQFGVSHKFAVTWSSLSDVAGGIVVKSAGKDAHIVQGTMDNTDIFKVMREVLTEE